MRKMKAYHIILPMLIMIVSSGAVYPEDKGPFFSFSYSPLGAGFLYVPGPGSRGGTDSTKPENGSFMTSASRLEADAGYFYRYLQADIGFVKSSAVSQKSEYASNKDLLDGDSSSYRIRFGRRFSTPGDTSYTWLYAGLKRYRFESSYQNVDLVSYGYIAGYSGFYSFGLAYDAEFVIKLDAFAGSYRYDWFTSSTPLRKVSRRYSISGGGGAGAGIQYEPYNISVLLKLSSDYDMFAFNSSSSGKTRKFQAGSHVHCIGFEIMYVLPDETYNEKKR